MTKKFSSYNCSPGNCRNLKFTSFPKPGYRLENHTVRTIEVFDEDLCRLQCYLEPNCVSYNFHKLRQASGTHKCDLNNATIEHDEDLVKNESYIYRGAEVRMTFISQEYETFKSLRLFYKTKTSTHQNIGYDN